jgi:hypothetical protein
MSNSWTGAQESFFLVAWTLGLSLIFLRVEAQARGLDLFAFEKRVNIKRQVQVGS